MTRRVASVLACATALVFAAGAAGQSTTIRVSDGDDVSGALDLRSVVFGRGSDGRLFARITMRSSWGARTLLAPESGGTPGAVCVRLWTARRPGAGPPDYLVCVTARDERTLAAGVYREPLVGLPERVREARLDRPTTRTATVRFSQSSIGRPALVTFAVEARRAGCETPSGCADLAPDRGATRRLRLRRASAD